LGLWWATAPLSEIDSTAYGQIYKRAYRYSSSHHGRPMPIAYAGRDISKWASEMRDWAKLTKSRHLDVNPQEHMRDVAMGAIDEASYNVTQAMQKQQAQRAAYLEKKQEANKVNHRNRQEIKHTPVTTSSNHASLSSRLSKWFLIALLGAMLLAFIFSIILSMSFLLYYGYLRIFLYGSQLFGADINSINIIRNELAMNYIKKPHGNAEAAETQ